MAVPPFHRTPVQRAPADPVHPPAWTRAAPWLLAAALLWVPAPAAARPGAGYAFPHIAVVGADGDRQTDDGLRAALAVGRRAGPRWDVEGEGLYERLDEPNGAQHQFGAAAHALYYLLRWAPFAPYALGGVGVMLVEDYFNESPRVFGELGGGIVSVLWRGGPSLRVDLRYRQVRKVSEFNDRVFADLSAGVGLVFPIGAPPPAAPAPMPMPAATPPPPPDGDADGDGILDRRDVCPETPPGTRVNPAGCTADLDRDGVGDGVDRCPGTPPGTPVDATGCPEKGSGDTDGDGVGDGADACPGTPADTAVDGKGCPPAEVLRLEGVHFAYDSADLTAPARAALAGVAAKLQARPKVRVEVAGHTDDRGRPAYNRELSRRRAEAVRARLVVLGVPPAMLTARGYGSADPVAAGTGDAARAMNRRVELRITETATP